jgi:hypothetical protein
MGDLCIGFPLYKSIPATWFGKFLALEKQSIKCFAAVDGAYITTSMQMIVDTALQDPNWDRLVIYEHDMLPPPDALERMAAYGPEKAVVGCVYFKRVPPHEAIVYAHFVNEQGEDDYQSFPPEVIEHMVANPGLYRCEAVGFGFTGIARHVLEEWPVDQFMFGRDGRNGRIGSHDIYFCENAAKLGHEIWVDSGIVCEHIGEMSVGVEHNRALALTEENICPT